MFPPSTMRPLPAEGSDDRSVAALGEPGLSLLRGPPGSYVPERLAGVISRWDRWRNCVWLRAGNVKAAALADNLAVACESRWGASEEDPGLGEGVDADLADLLRRAPSDAVVVLEFPGRVPATVVRWMSEVRPIVRSRKMSLVAVTEHRSPAVSLGGLGDVVRAWNVRAPSALDDPAGLLPRDRRRVAEIAGRQAVVVRDVIDAARVWTPEPVARAIEVAHRPGPLMDVLTADLLDRCSAEQRAALEVCIVTGYWHPQLATHPVDVAELRPWVVPLEEHWGWLRPAWTRSLARHLGERPRHRHRSGAGGPPLRDRTPTVTASPAREPVVAQESCVTLLEARLLGRFEVRVDGRTVTEWPGRLGPSLLRYLLARPRHACSRDELLAEFWPDVAPDVARNRLQVVVSGLRRCLGEVTPVPVIAYGRGEYRIGSGVRVETDAARFEAALGDARAAERSADAPGAQQAYQRALDLYRGDFAADAPYDDWTMLPRESLRIGYIDALDRMICIHLDAGQLEDAIATGHRTLEVDPCREDVHRTLMRCYAQQGRVHQAVRQYEFCVRVLRARLDTDPRPWTTELCRSIGEATPALPSE